MKLFKKIAAVAMTAMLACAAFTGCGSAKGSSDTWIVGTNAEFPPFEFVSSSQGVIDQYSGIDVELIKMIGEENGKTVTINNMEFDSLTLALKNGQVNVIIAGMTVTEDRKEEVDFSEPYYVAKQVMIVKEDSTLSSAADLAGKSIAVVAGYTGETLVQDLGYKLGTDYQSFKKGTDAVLELVNGKCDVVVIDSATANQYLKDNAGLKIVEDSSFESEEYAIAVKKGDTETLNMINASIQKMKADGTIDKLSAKYADVAE